MLQETVDVILPTKNEEVRIKNCILQFRNTDVNRVIVIDESTDHTADIAKEYADIVVRFPEKVEEPHQARLYNFGKTLTNAEWVLISDVDEVWPKAFLKNIKKIIAEMQRKESTLILAFRFPRDNYSLRGEPKSTWPDWQVRLCLRQAIEWRDEVHSIPYSVQHNTPVDEVSCETLDSFPIIHLPRNQNVKRPWWRP